MRRFVFLILLIAFTLGASAQTSGIFPLRARITPANAADVSLYMMLARRADRLLWSPGGSILAVVDGVDIDLYNVSSWLDAPRRIRLDQTLTDFVFSPDGSLLYTLAGGAMVAWNVETASLSQRYVVDARHLAVSPSGEYLAVLGRQNIIQMINAETREIYTINPTVRPDDIAYSSDGTRLFISDGLGGGEIIDIALRTTERMLEGADGPLAVLPASAAYSSEGRRLYSQNASGIDAIYIYNPRTGEQTGILSRPPEYQRVFGWGLNTRTNIAVGAAVGMTPEQSAVLVWSMTGGDPLVRLRHAGVRDVQPSPDGTLIASVGGGSLRLWAAGESMPTQLQTASLSQVNVVAACDTYNVRPALGEVLDGQTVSLVWSWYASNSRLVRDYLDVGVMALNLNGAVVRPWIFVSEITEDSVNDGYPTVYLYAPIGSLTRGQNAASITVTWHQTISDGFSDYGPGSSNTTDGGECAFTVR